MSNEWIGVDLDGTLAECDGWENSNHIGKPVPLMLDRVKRWIAEDINVKIFTARVSSKNPNKDEEYKIIKDWCKKYVGVELDITAEKDFYMFELWDDRCVPVEINTGLIMSTERLQREDI